ncbi:MAG: PEGA domain-containing protein [bacterium]|nr:PEGA domain-containing protein [bacterium]
MGKTFVVLALFFPAFFLPGCNFEGGKAALRVTAEPEATVFLDGEHVGKTPLSKEGLPTGRKTLRLVREDAAWTQEVEFIGSVWTMVAHRFAPAPEEEATEIVTGTRGEGMILTSVPDGAKVVVDEEQVGMTPLSLPTAALGPHSVRLEKEGYESRSIVGLHVEKGFATNVFMQLPRLGQPPSKSELPKEASVSAVQKQEVRVLETATGWLRVRGSPSLSGVEIAKLTTGDTVPLLEEGDGWVKVKLEDGTDGWVSQQFVEILKE